jgi:hypothetical protein
MRRFSTAVLLILVLGSIPLRAAPAPADPPLPDDVRLTLESIMRLPEEIERCKHLSTLFGTTDAAREAYARHIAIAKREYYTEPVKALKLFLTHPLHIDKPQDQTAIRAALRKYERRLERARKQGLVE